MLHHDGECSTNSAPFHKPALARASGDGESYEGEWAHGVSHGSGRYAYKDGSEYRG